MEPSPILWPDASAVQYADQNAAQHAAQYAGQYAIQYTDQHDDRFPAQYMDIYAHLLVLSRISPETRARVNFLAGPTSILFPLDRMLLSHWTPAFPVPPFPAPIDIINPPPHPTIRVPSIAPDLFVHISTWLYTRRKPVFRVPADLLLLCRLWVALGELGLWQWMNTLLRLGMEVAQPVEFEVPMSVVQWVYARTKGEGVGAKLRAFVVAIWCQRAPRDAFAEVRVGREFWDDVVKFMRALEEMRVKRGVRVGGSAAPWQWGVDGKGFPVITFAGGEGRGLVKGEWECALPAYIVFNSNGWDLPDDFFVGWEEVGELAMGVAEQLVAQTKQR